MTKAKQKKPSARAKADDKPKPQTVGEKIAAYGLDKILEEIENCHKFQDIAVRVGVSRNGMLNWLNDNAADLYAQAREERAHTLANEILDIADNDVREQLLLGGVPCVDEHGEKIIVVSSAKVQHAKLRVDTRKWLASKMLPKVYGDKQELNVSGSLDIAATIIAARKRIGGDIDGN